MKRRRRCGRCASVVWCSPTSAGSLKLVVAGKSERPRTRGPGDCWLNGRPATACGDILFPSERVASFCCEWLARCFSALARPLLLASRLLAWSRANQTVRGLWLSCSLSGRLNGEHDRMVLSGLLIARQHSRIVGWRRQAVGVGGLMFPYRFKPVECSVSNAIFGRH